MSIYTEFVSILVEPVMKEILLLGRKKTTNSEYKTHCFLQFLNWGKAVFCTISSSQWALGMDEYVNFND